MYIETSSPRQKGDNARLEYSVPVSYTGKSSCLTFYYHMYGYGIHTLNLFNGNTTVFTKSGNQGNQWFMAKITLTIQSKVSCILTLFLASLTTTCMVQFLYNKVLRYYARYYCSMPIIYLNNRVSLSRNYRLIVAHGNVMSLKQVFASF